jgi:hypothetical protein
MRCRFAIEFYLSHSPPPQAVGQPAISRAWARKHFSDEFKKKEETLVASLWDLLELRPPDSPSANRLTTLINRLIKERKRAAEKQRFVHVPNEPIQGYQKSG